MNQRISELIWAARENAERGAVMFLVAITALIVMVAGAIAVDLSAVATRGQSLQNAADSAALAGVQAYRQSMGDRTDATAVDEAAAIAAVQNLLAQNGITDITPGITFPDAANDTEVSVTLFDDDAGFLLAGFTGGAAGTVERTATARFERCEDGCLKEVEIPPPFQPVNTQGDGDGYKPIPVNDRLYSINHQSGDGRGTQQITCVLREPRKWTFDESRETQLCWDSPGGTPVAGLSAYPAGNVPFVTPEMPHAAVVGSTIYWASSTSSGHYLFCFETETAQPCSSPLRLNSNTAATNLSKRLIHRGGGTVEEDGLVYTFTDDNMVHCVIPNGPIMTLCGGYPKSTSLGEMGFPANDKADGNHGSSIDRIVDDASNRIYSTHHVDSVPCPQGHMDVPTGTVTFTNANSGILIQINDAYDGLVDGVDPTDPRAHWRVSGGTSNGNRYYIFTNVAASDNGYTRRITLDTYGTGQQLELTSGTDGGRIYFRVFAGSTASQIRSWYSWGGQHHYISEGSSGGVIEFTSGPAVPLWSDWVIECGSTTETGDYSGGLAYEQGTYLNCFNASGAGGACNGFTPSKLHDDWDSFSGRLFFYRDGGGNVIGVCSTGFTEHWDWYTNMSSYTELSCVDHNTGAEAVALEQSMAQFTATLASHNTATPNPSEGNARWGTWGDPHYNSWSNRIFYPTHRTDSAVLCWDFDTGPCVEGIERNGTSALGEIQDYGFFSEGNCVYGLGHKAIFWAFRADNIQEECNGSGKTTSITPCDCGGSLFWGTLSFDVSVEQFDEFLIEINDDDGNRVYPASSGDPSNPAPAHSLLHDGDTIDLNFIPTLDANQRLWVTVSVVAKTGIDPWQDGAGSQTFTIEIERTPRLTD